MRDIVAPVILLLITMVALGAMNAPASEEADATADDPAFEVLIVGGDADHDFDRWFDEESTATLEEVGAEVTYTDEPQDILDVIYDIDVLYLSNNQPMEEEELRTGIFNFVNSGKGLLIVHAASWYSWGDWPEYYEVLVGGGTSYHPPYGPFEVTIQDPEHPIMQGVPETFTIEDELYHFERDPEGTPMHVLATGEDPETGEEYPVVWIVEHYSGRIVVNTLGHDGGAHEHSAFRQILQNSALWAARQDVQ